MDDTAVQVGTWVLSSLFGGGGELRAAIVAVDWADVQALSGWVGLLSVAGLLGITEYLRRTFATKEAIASERQDREKADEARDREMHRVAEMVQQFIGKVEVIERRQEKADRAREREVADLREEVRTGFAKMEALLNRNGGD